MTSFDFSVIGASLPYLAKGLQYTLTLTLVAFNGGLLGGAGLALARLTPWPWLRVPAGLYVNLMRSIPLVLVIFWFYFLVPILGQWLLQTPYPLRVGPDQTAFISFTLFEMAYCCEIIRAGLQSVPTGQVEAAQALGLSYAQQMRYVLLPQAWQNMWPVLLTQAIVLFQDTSLVYVISITDFLGAAAKIAQRDGRLLEMYSFTALVYFLISFGLSWQVKRWQGRTPASS